MVNSLQARFVIIMFAATILFAVPLFVAFSIISARSLELHTTARRQQVMEANANALAKPLWDFDNEGVARISAAIGQASEIRGVAVSSLAGAIVASSPSLDKPQPSQGIRLDTKIIYKSSDGDKDVGTLTLWFSEVSPTIFYKREVAWTGILFMASILVLVVSAIVANHHMTVKPLRQLAQAIQCTKQLGSRHHVGLRSKTEIGELARTFDEMQERLAYEEAELTLAHSQAVNLYNRTPAMLFSLDSQGRVSAVSDHWLGSTGYERSQVIGMPFADLLIPEDSETFRLARAGLNASACNDIIVRFRCAGGHFIVVLVRETGAVQIGVDASTSLCVMTDITALKEAERKIHLQAVTDQLTNLLNRHGFEEELNRRNLEADAAGTEVGCLYLDLDRFKPINDDLGHHVGDQVLTVVAGRLKNTLDVGDVAARLGGDEFSILVSGTGVGARLGQMKASVEQALRQPIAIGFHHLSVGASIGSAVYPTEARSASDLIKVSDAAMYRVKHSTPRHHGRRSNVAANVDEQFVTDCLDNNWFDAFFQSIVNLSTGKLVGFEALMRVRHPRDGVLLPTRVIEVAERMGLVSSIDELVMRRSIAGLAQLHADKRFGKVYLTINASPHTINMAYLATVLETAAQHGIQPEHLVLEITENSSLLGLPAGREAIKAFRAKGGRVAIDDFGTGYSSFAYLCEDLFDIIKIDKSLTSVLTSDLLEKRGRAQTVLANIGSLARQMNYEIIAEGIECETQSRLARCAGISLGQGFLFSKAKPLDEWLPEMKYPAFNQGALNHA